MNFRIPLVRDGLVCEPENKKSLTPLANKTILDVGCGGGILSEVLIIFLINKIMIQHIIGLLKVFTMTNNKRQNKCQSYFI